MSDKNNKTAAAQDPEAAIENALSQTEAFFEKNWKTIVYAVAAVVVVVGLYFAYDGLYSAPREKKAAAMMFAAEQLFGQQEYRTALEGDGNTAGFLEVIEKYGSTPQGNIAKHYAGICYLKEGDLDNALSYLAKYKSTEGIPNQIVNAQNIGLQGDIYVQKGDLAKAVEMYGKAVKSSDNDFTAPYYLKKLGLAQLAAGNAQAAVESYKTIADKYPSSMEARDIEKYIGAAEQK